MTEEERHEQWTKITDEITKTAGQFLTVCGQVAVAESNLERARKNQHDRPQDIAPAAQEFRAREAELQGLVTKLIDLHRQVVALAEG